MTEEQSLREELIILHRHYMEACEPIIKRLAAIERMKPPMCRESATSSAFMARSISRSRSWSGSWTRTSARTSV